jgi:hypothetical protein
VQDLGERWLAEPAECERRERDAELRRRQERVEVLRDAQRAVSSCIAGTGLRLEGRRAHPRHGEFGRNKQGVRQYTKQRQEER